MTEQLFESSNTNNEEQTTNNTFELKPRASLVGNQLNDLFDAWQCNNLSPHRLRKVRLRTDVQAAYL